MGQKSTQKRIDNFISDALAIEAQEANEAGAIGFMARAMVQATMPHSRPKGYVFKRTNGAFTLVMQAHPDIGLPYGTIPRLLMAWLTSEAVKTKEKELILGPSLSGFMSELDLIPSGGRWGTITRLKDQMKRLFTCSVSCSYDIENDGQWGEVGFRLIKETKLWWDPKHPNQGTLWNSKVILSADFFEEIINHPIPIDIRVLKSLKNATRSPMAIDLYCWLTYRMSYLKKQTFIPWGALQAQFGADYADSKQGRYDFKRAFQKHLQAVQVIYPAAKVNTSDRGLFLKPSKTHILKTSERKIVKHKKHE